MLDVPAARALLERTRPTQPTQGYPAEVRPPVLELVRRELAEGINLNAIARSLGLNRGTLRYWLDHPAKSPGFVPVLLQPEPQVVTPVPAQLQPTLTSPAGLTLISPAGFRLDGLNLDQAIHALSRLT